jgi:aryl-alcohol dehydrogenase-like predicted oxidoreductase
MLGTVQFGLPYGIANRSGQPSFAQVRDILSYAYEGGVNCLDTAASYGSSEEVFGRALAELGIADRMIVITKIDHLQDELSPAQADAAVERSVLRSLKRLRMEVLPVCLFHLEQNIRYAESLQKLKDRGLVRHIGISTVTVGATKAIVSSGKMEAIQVPTNVLERRFVKEGVCAEAVQRRMAVFARSIYLQGLILLSDEETPPHLQEIASVRRRLIRIAQQAGISLGELAIRRVLGINELTCVLVGVESIAQIKQDLSYVFQGHLDADITAAVDEAVPDLPERITNPVFWKGARTGRGKIEKSLLQESSVQS